MVTEVWNIKTASRGHDPACTECTGHQTSCFIWRAPTDAIVTNVAFAVFLQQDFPSSIPALDLALTLGPAPAPPLCAPNPLVNASNVFIRRLQSTFRRDLQWSCVCCHEHTLKCSCAHTHAHAHLDATITMCVWVVPAGQRRHFQAEIMFLSCRAPSQNIDVCVRQCCW